LICVHFKRKKEVIVYFITMVYINQYSYIKQSINQLELVDINGDIEMTSELLMIRQYYNNFNEIILGLLF
jgi:hypothetical protein